MRRIFIIIIPLIVIVFVVAIVVVSLTHKESSQTTQPKGSSTYPQFDVVSGDIAPNDAKTIVSNLDAYTGKELTSTDFAIRKGSYQKSYTHSGTGYTITMLIDTKVPSSTYQATIEHSDTSDAVTVECAPESQQIGGAHCVNAYEGAL